MNSTPLGTLTDIRDEFYAGSWDTMLSDLDSRLGRKPYNYRLECQIRADIQAIKETLRNYKEPLDR